METDRDAFMARASAATGGLTDAGDPFFDEALDVLLASAATDARLSPLGEAAFEATIEANLVNRLRVTDHHARHPELAHEQIVAPLVLIGLPRTGTTALSHLLSADPANRSLLAWEANQSVPPPTTEGYATDPRFLAALDAPDMLGMLNPEFKAIHHDPPDMPVECAVILGQTFVSLVHLTINNLDGYLQWLTTADHHAAYGYHRQVLQLLQSQCPGRWQLKSPVHLVHPEALGATYPDARWVLTHRDPVEVTASVLSLVRSLTGTFTDEDFTEYIAATWPEVIATLLDHQSAFRDAEIAAGRGDAFVDVAYADLVAEPVGTVAGIYDRLGEPFTAEAEAAMAAHAAQHRQGVHGRHSYSLAEFGLRPEPLAERVAHYTTRYASYLEPTP